MRAKKVNESLISFRQWREDIIDHLRNDGRREDSYWNWFIETKDFDELLSYSWQDRRSSKEVADEIIKVGIEDGTLDKLMDIEESRMKDDPCWSGYEMIGAKTKGGKEVPNCVKIK